MGKHDWLAKSLAIVGTVLVTVPLVLPLLASVFTIGSPGGYMVDYLMPFEVYPIAVAGAALLLWASFRVHEYRRAVAISIGVMFAGVLLGGVSANLTGIANSVETLEWWRYAVTIAFGVASLIGQVVLAAIGGMITRDLFVKHEDATPPMMPAGV